MDRASILTYLSAVEEHISSGERQIIGRRDFILSLKCAGCDTTDEVALLREMERAQMEHLAERDRLRAELAVLNAVETAKEDAAPNVAAV
jgi:hypothetical protein